MADYGQPATANAPPASTTASAGAPATDDLSVGKLRKQYMDYLGAKSGEIKEQRDGRHYYHSNQWTPAEVAELNRRKQPVVTYNRIGRKIDGVVGLLERLRQDPKAFRRSPPPEQQDAQQLAQQGDPQQMDQSAEVATATLRYVLDISDWKAKSPEAVRACGIEGQGGVALTLIEGDHGDPDVDLELVDNDLFFYDPRSFRSDYSDARFMGVCKWIDEDTAKELFTDKASDIGNLIETGGEFDSEATRDRQTKWVNTASRQIRVVDHWYQWKGQWCWCLYSGNTELARGASPYFDQKGKTICRYIMFAAAIDHDGDRYGFVRNLKSAQDELNHRRSKSLYGLMGRRMIAREGTLKDVEATRREAVRPDGVIIYREEKPEFDDAKSEVEFRAQVELTQEAKDEIENFGPNQALIGQGLDSQSGRAIALLQQAGLAELGPFIIAHRQWKIRVYRAIWNAVQRYWTAERWIRVTDNEGLAQFIQLNGAGLDQNGMPAMVNGLGALDVDIILDEGPDTINMQADAYEALKGMGPNFQEMFPEAFIELSPLPESLKKTMRDKVRAQQQPDPMAEQAKQITLAGEQAKVEETQSKTLKNVADAHAAVQPDMQAQPAAPAPTGPKPPAVAINFKDMPPEAQAQALREAGIFIHPATLAAHAENLAAQAASLKAASRPQAPTAP